MVDYVISDGGKAEVGLDKQQAPKNGDCAVRALALYLNVPYTEALELMHSATSFTLTKKGGTPFEEYKALLLSLGMKYVRARIRVNSATATSKLPREAILIFKTHAVAYKNGTIHDSFYTTMHAGLKQTMGYFYTPKYV